MFGLMGMSWHYTVRVSGMLAPQGCQAECQAVLALRHQGAGAQLPLP